MTAKSSGGTTLAQFFYDEDFGPGYYGKGRRTTMKFGPSLGNWVKTYYDARGRVIRTDVRLGTNPYYDYTITSTYDDADRVATIAYPNGEVVAYRYGDHGLPVSLESSVRGKIVSNATYNALGKLFDVTLGNGLTTGYRYWGPDYGGNAHHGLLRSITTGSAQSLTYTDYDPEGNLKQLIDIRNGNEAINFSYDHLDRLTHAWSGLFDETYSYDAIGNFGSKGGVSYQYPSGYPSSHPHAPNQVGGNQYLYDNNGNLTSAEGRSYEYDDENRLSRVLEGGSPIRTLTYDGDGALRSVDESGQKTLYITPDYQLNLATGEITVYYRFGGRAVAWRSILNNVSTLRYVLADHLSSTQAEIGEDQAEMGQRRNYPFGTDRAISGTPDIADKERFTGQKRIGAPVGSPRKELYYYGARWYLPGVGIFTQPDTVVPDYKNPQALNRYAYVYNNPPRYTDSTGHYTDDDLRELLGEEAYNNYLGEKGLWRQFSEDQVKRLMGFLYSDEANRTPGLTKLLQLLGTNASIRDAWLARASRQELGRLNTARTTLFFALYPSWEGKDVHGFFDRVISSTSDPAGRNELEGNSWLYEMNRNIMPVAAAGAGVDLGDFTPRTKTWGAYAAAPGGYAYITAHNKDLAGAWEVSSQQFDALTVAHWQTGVAFIFAGAAISYEKMYQAGALLSR